MSDMSARTVKLGLRVTPGEQTVWKTEAKAADLTLSHYLRRMIAVGRVNTSPAQPTAEAD